MYLYTSIWSQRGSKEFCDIGDIIRFLCTRRRDRLRQGCACKQWQTGLRKNKCGINTVRSGPFMEAALCRAAGILEQVFTRTGCTRYLHTFGSSGVRDDRTYKYSRRGSLCGGTEREEKKYMSARRSMGSLHGSSWRIPFAGEADFSAKIDWNSLWKRKCDYNRRFRWSDLGNEFLIRCQRLWLDGKECLLMKIRFVGSNIFLL